MDKVAAQGGFRLAVWFPTVSIVPPLLHTHMSSIYHRRYIILENDSAVKENPYRN
jgi:hypothetical protein